MHISEGVLSVNVIGVGAALTAVGVGLGLWKTDYDRIPMVAVLSSAFFVASLIPVPIGGTSAHLILNGLMGIVLGWAAFPAVLVALLLQAVLFGVGGLSTLGVNTANAALPAVLCYYLFGRVVRTSQGRIAFAFGFASGVTAIALTCALLSASLLLTGQGFATVVKLAVIAHVPIAVIEGLVTGAVVVFVRQVCPQLLGTSAQAA